jgi:hypothetical protein
LVFPGLEFEDINTSESEVVQIRERTADSAATTALNRGGARSVHRVDDFDRQTAAIIAHHLESRSFARRGEVIDPHQRTQSKGPIGQRLIIFRPSGEERRSMAKDAGCQNLFLEGLPA